MSALYPRGYVCAIFTIHGLFFFFLYKTHTAQSPTCHFKASNIQRLVKLKLRSVELAALLRDICMALWNDKGYKNTEDSNRYRHHHISLVAVRKRNFLWETRETRILRTKDLRLPDWHKVLYETKNTKFNFWINLWLTLLQDQTILRSLNTDQACYQNLPDYHD